MTVAAIPSHLDAFVPESTTSVTINVGAEVVGTLDDDILTGGGDSDRIIGGSGWDALYGLGDDDILYGNTGRDTLDGGDDDDLLYGGQDDDLLRGGDGDDVLYGGANSEAVYVLRDGIAILLDARDTLSGGAGEDLIYGNQGADLLDGGADDDILYGGQGTDTLSGGSGADTLFGGADGDRFVYGAANEGRDVIEDFDATQDQILLAAGVSVAIRVDIGDDATLRLSTGTRITLIGVADPDDIAVAGF